MSVTHKYVNIYPNYPIMTNPPIRVKQFNKKISIADIRKCLMSQAIVDEILNDGTVIRLGLHNYNIDNQPKARYTAIDKPTDQILEPIINKESDKLSAILISEDNLSKVEETNSNVAYESLPEITEDNTYEEKVVNPIVNNPFAARSNSKKNRKNRNKNKYNNSSSNTDTESIKVVDAENM